MRKPFIRLGLLAVALAVVILASGDQSPLRAVPASASAPPTFTQVSMPDFGQHSKNWCWVASAANAFWWLEHGPDGVAGTADDPVPGIVPAAFRVLPDPASIVAGDYFDNNDPVPPPPRPGYRTLLKQIAQTTFRDGNISMDGIRQAANEATYKYSEGVNLWDYLVGLRDYVEARNVPLVVSTITDPAAVAPGGCLDFAREPTPGQTVSRVPTSFEAPTLKEYARQVSRSQAVIVVLGFAGGGGHVMTGVGYDLTSNPQTITVSDPLTHVAVPHDDHNAAIPGPIAPKDHNNAPGHNPSPYDVCTVTSAAPQLQVTCPAVTGQIASLVMISPPGVGGIAELPEVAGTPLETDGSSGASAGVLVGAIAGAVLAGGVTLGGAAWYARRRLSSR